MHIFNKRLYGTAFITILALFPLGCTESDTSNNAIQAELDALILDLAAAMHGNDGSSTPNTPTLEGVISEAMRLSPSSQSQIQSKNLLLSTARGKLAQLQFLTISAEARVASTKLHLAVSQATQVSILRSKASALSDAGQQQNNNVSQAIQLAIEPLVATFNTQLNEATIRISNLETQSKADRKKASVLRDSAEELFAAAEQAGLIDGHSIFKHGVKTIRQSQRADMIASTIELERHFQAEPLREDARAELEAIGSILSGLRNTSYLLRQFRESAIEGAASLRQVADDLDNETAVMMNTAIDAASNLMKRWDNVTSLAQEALQGSNRIRHESREATQAAAAWKLDLEWTLGHIEESRRKFLMEEAQALTFLIDSGIVTSAGKWRELSNVTSALIEQATINAISAYENAKRQANNAGSKGEILASQLEARIALLKGIPFNQIVGSSTVGGPSESHQTSIGFATPQDLVHAFNDALFFTDLDGSSPAVELTLFYFAADEASSNTLQVRQNLHEAGSLLLIAIRSNMGEDAVSEFKDSVPSSPSDEVDIELGTIQMQGERQATATDINGVSVTLQQTPQGWKILYGASSEEAAMNAMMLDMQRPVIKAMNTVTKQINDGLIQSIDQLQSAFESAMMGV